MLRKILVVVLCVCMLVNFSAQPVHAMGAEGIIIGGAAAAGVTLTVGQVALIVAAGFGLIYAVTHADELGSMLESALSSAASNDETRLEQLTNWKTGALGGIIALATAPSWIKGVINNWTTDLYEATSSSGVLNPVMSLPAGEPAYGSNFWLASAPTYTFTKDVTVLRAGRIGTTTLSGGLYYSLSSYCVYVSTEFFKDSLSYTYNGQKYYYYNSYTGLNPPADVELAGDNLVAYEAINTLPSFDEIREAYGSIQYQYSIIRAWVDGLLKPVQVDNSICPDVTVGGIGNALEEHSIDNINIPDINVGQSGLLAPDEAGSISANLDDILTRLKEQELTWKEYMDDVATGTPTVSIPAEGTETGTLDFPITDTGISETPLDKNEDEPTTNPPKLHKYSVDLKRFFPFCIPFDIVEFVNTLCAEPEAPRFTWGFPTGDGETEEMEIDLAVFDPVAEILRGMELLLFCIGLAIITRSIIRG